MIRTTWLIMILCATALGLIAQGKLAFGIKGGLNFANVTNAESIKQQSDQIYVWSFLSPTSQVVLAYRCYQLSVQNDLIDDVP